MGWLGILQGPHPGGEGQGREKREARENREKRRRKARCQKGRNGPHLVSLERSRSCRLWIAGKVMKTTMLLHTITIEFGSFRVLFLFCSWNCCLLPVHIRTVVRC